MFICFIIFQALPIINYFGELNGRNTMMRNVCEIISYLYLPEVKFNEEDFVHIENLEGDWYFAIYNYQPIQRKYTE